jgi:hypothetical protein
MSLVSSDPRDSLRALRPEISTIDLAAASSAAEQFQQDTLRPLLKYQNKLLVAAFVAYAQEKKGVFFKLTGPARATYIEERFQKDPQLRHFFMGMLVGHFTLEEYARYRSCEKEIRKRAIDLLIQRLQDQVGSLMRDRSSPDLNL